MVDLIRRTVPLSRGATERRRNLREKETTLRGQTVWNCSRSRKCAKAWLRPSPHCPSGCNW